VGIFDRLDQLADQLGDLIANDDVRAHVELGAAYLDRGDLASAIHELGLAVELKPDHARALYLLGVAYARRGDDAEAVDALSRAAAMRDGFAQAHVALGEIYRRRGDLEAAADSYRTALEGNLGDPAVRGEVYRGLGAVYLSSRRLDKAVRELRKAVASLPDDSEAHALLGRSLFLSGDLEGARLCLERAARVDKPGAAALETLGELYERLGRSADASDSYAKTLAAASELERDATRSELEISARLGLARLWLASGDAITAHGEVTHALALAPDRPDILVMLGRVSAAGGATDAALTAFDRALVATAGGVRSTLLFDRRPVLEEALRVALRAGTPARASAYASALLADHPEHPDALAASALTAAEAGDLDRAQSLVDRALAPGETLEARLAAAEIAARRAQPAQAAASLRRAAQLAPNDPRPRARLTEIYQREREAVPSDLYGLLQLAHRHFNRTRELSELGPEAARLLETLDRPLLVTVMGEFNAGKSTFVNALLGEEVAPMGITPTTATINVLKYGAERKGRVVYLDGNTREVAWSDVPALLRGLDAAEAKRIRTVEVLYPLETLQRVNVVDTPGLNSIHPEHEEAARRFIAEADAVIWLFSIDQAAKATEGSALEKIRGEGKKILGVLNKIDRCTPEELDKIVAHVQEALGEHLETVVPVSAREALAGRRKNDAEQLARSNYALLDRTLEERFFSRARAIQREAAHTRLGHLLDRADAIAKPLAGTGQLDALDAALAAVRADALLFQREFLRAERTRLLEAAEVVYAACAREVLDFVRPRRWAFGSNEAAPADRDFLLGLLDERLGSLLDASRARVQTEVERSLTALRAALPEADLRLALRLLDEQVYGRYRAFARGFLRGGRVDGFFTRVLPKLELSEREIRRALEREVPWSDDNAEAELRTPLAAWAERFYAALVTRLEKARAVEELSRLDVEERVALPLGTLRAALGAV
jgi:small GTP-binding protein